METPTARVAPGPKGLPYLGSVLEARRDPIGLFARTRAELGDVVRFKFGPIHYHLVNDPDAIKHVLVDNAKAYTKSRNYVGLKVVLGEGLLTSEGDAWRRQRKLAQPAFHKSRLDGFARSMASSTRDLLARWQAEGDAKTFDIHAEMMRLTFRIVGLTLFSTDVDDDACEVGPALDIAMHWANAHAESFVPIPRFVPTPANVRFNRAMKTLDRVVNGMIETRRHRENPGDDLLGMLMSAVDEDGGRMSDRQLRDELLTMVLAGHETTANLLTWTFVLLSRHPEVAQRVREEAIAVLGSDRDPTLDDVKSLPYARMVLDEGMRLYPPAWTFERQATERDVIGGYTVEPGHVVAISPYILHRHPAYWENPETFDPERFSPARSQGRGKYTYLPFGGGPRTCIGNHFALMEAQIILAMIARDYRVDLDPSHPVVLEPVITLRPKHGIVVRRHSSAATKKASSECPAPRTPIESPAASL